MAGGDEADLDLAEPHALAISHRPAVLLAVARRHDRQRLGRRPHLAMPAAGVIGMAVGDQRARLGLRRIDPGVGRPYIDAFGKRLDPGTQAGHCGIIAVNRRTGSACGMEMDMDMGGLNLFTMEVIGVVILGVVLLWVVLRTRSKGKETSNPRTEQATRELYEAEDKAAKHEEL